MARVATPFIFSLIGANEGLATRTTPSRSPRTYDRKGRVATKRAGQEHHGPHPTSRPADSRGIGAILKVTFLDSGGVSHRLLVRGPYVRCRDHESPPEREPLAHALATMTQRRACLRVRIGWQRHLLAAEPKAGLIRTLPPAVREYLDEQTKRHATRLDLALGDRPPDARARRRWHEVGWRAAPTLAARYQDAGVEAAVAFLAYRNGFDPSVVERVLADPTSPLSRALVEHRRVGYTIRELELGQHALVTDDLPYEPFEPLRLVKPLLRPSPMRDWRGELRVWLAGADQPIAVEDILEAAGLRADALRTTAAWCRTVAMGYARTPNAPDVEVVLAGMVAGIEVLRPRRRGRATSASRAR
jgi:hypothetical protein